MVSDCAEGFSWCAINQKFKTFQQDLSLYGGGNCIAMDPIGGDLKSFQCTKRLYFVCEVCFNIKYLNFNDDLLFEIKVYLQQLSVSASKRLQN